MKRFSTRTLTLAAMLVALQIVLSKFLRVQMTDSIRLSIDSVPILLAGIWLGPVAGGAVGAVADLLGTVLFPTAGAYYPLLTVAFLLIGLVSGLCALAMKQRKPLLRALVCVVPAELAGSLLFKSYALSALYGVPFGVLLAARALPVCAVLILNVFLVALLDRLLGARVLAERAEKTDASDTSAAMTYDEALAYIHSVTWRGSRLGLERTNELLEKIGNPQKALKFVHIAGTNGKGSTAAMLARVFTLAGYRTGLYISPFINRFNERMQLNGEPIPDDTLAEITAFVRPFADAMADHPTEFELITVIALEYYRRVRADIVIFEVGMGGELDSTNVIDTPELAVITNIGLDHTRELGPAIPDIARAKAGIIKPGGDVLIYGGNPEADAVFAETCRRVGARMHVTDHARVSNVCPTLDALTFIMEPYGELSCGLVGSYQSKNAAVAVTAVELLRQKGWNLPDSALKTGLASVRWPARFEVLRRNPVFVADGGHNPQGVAAAAESLKAHFPNQKITFLLGVMADKDIPHMIEQIGPLAARFIAVTPRNPRAMEAAALAGLLQKSGYEAAAEASVESGVQKAIELAGPDGVVCALGSLYMLGDVRAALNVQ